MFAVRITPAIKHRTLDLKLTTQRRHTLPVQYPARYCNPIFHPENSGTCHPNLRSMQLSLFSSVSSLGSTPVCHAFLCHAFSNARRTDDVIGYRTYGKTNERQEDRCKYIVPARTSHFASAEHNVREQELERDPWNVEDRGRHARLHLLDNDILKAYALKFAW